MNAPDDRAQHAADIMQARLSWPAAHRYAAELDRVGVLESGDEAAAVAILADHMPLRRAEALVKDLRTYDAMGQQ